MNLTYYPKIPAHLSTIRSGNQAERWAQRRRIIIQQRDVLLARLGVLDGIVLAAPWAAYGVKPVVRRLEGQIRGLNRRIDECNEAIESLHAVRPVRISRRAGGG